MSSNYDKIGSDPLGFAFLIIPFNVSVWFLASLGVIYTAFHIVQHSWRKHFVTIVILVMATTLYAPNKYIRGYWKRVAYAERQFWHEVFSENISDLPLSEYKKHLRKRTSTKRMVESRIKSTENKKFSSELIATLHDLGFSVLHISHVDPKLIEDHIAKCKSIKKPDSCDFSSITENKNLSDEAFEYVVLNVERYSEIYSMIHNASRNTERLRKIQTLLPGKTKLDQGSLESMNNSIENYLSER